MINRPLIGLNNNDEHYKALIRRPMKNDKNHDTPRMYASIPVGSAVAVQCEDEGTWTHRIVESKGDHNHNDRTCTIWVTKIGWLITRKSKHMKPTQLTSEQYIWDQLDKYTVTDPLEDILKQLEKQTHTNHTHTQSEWLRNTQHGTHTNNTIHENLTTNNRESSSLTKRDVNNGQRSVVIMCHFTKILRRRVRGMTLTSDQDMEG